MRVDIAVEVYMLSSMMVLPREGHSEQLFNICTYLKQRYKSEMIVDPIVPDINEDLFPK